MSPILDSKAKLFDVIDSLDAVIVGSDQVWRLSMVKGMETEYFLDFATPQCKKIAYAASFGTDRPECDSTLQQRITKLLQQFTAVSVREQEGVAICKEYFETETVQTVDPTLLVSASTYLPLIQPLKPRQGELFYYLLGS